MIVVVATAIAGGFIGRLLAEVVIEAMRDAVEPLRSAAPPSGDPIPVRAPRGVIDPLTLAVVLSRDVVPEEDWFPPDANRATIMGANKSRPDMLIGLNSKPPPPAPSPGTRIVR